MFPQTDIIPLTPAPTNPKTEAFVRDITMLARHGFLPRRCWIYQDGIHVTHLYHQRPKIAENPWATKVEDGYPLWIEIAKTATMGRGKLHRRPCLIRVTGSIVRVIP